MPPAKPRHARFVRALLRGEVGQPDAGGTWSVVHQSGPVILTAAEVATFIDGGVLLAAEGRLRAGRGARAFVLAQQEAKDRQACAPRAPETASAMGRPDESPLARLARARPGETEAFLLPHQVEAGERICRLAERAALRPRVTMSYDPTRTAARRSGGVGEIGDLAADARAELGRLLARLPRDCAGVVLDVCVFGRGLQEIESARGWPRRSGKLVLRIGLEQAAQGWGLRPSASGPEQTRQRTWFAEGALPTVVG